MTLATNGPLAARSGRGTANLTVLEESGRTVQVRVDHEALTEPVNNFETHFVGN